MFHCFYQALRNWKQPIYIKIMRKKDLIFFKRENHCDFFISISLPIWCSPMIILTGWGTLEPMAQKKSSKFGQGFDFWNNQLITYPFLNDQENYFTTEIWNGL